MTPPLESAPDPVLAIDIGGTKIEAGVVTPAGAVLGLHRVPTPARLGADAVIDAARQCAVQSLALAPQDGSTRVRRLAVASAGVVQGPGGLVSHATDSLPGWAGTAVGDRLSAHLGLPATVLNDVHAQGLGEAVWGAGAGHPSMLLVAVGTGVGGCLVLNQRVVSGARGVAGHLGHLPVPEADGVPCPCGRRGHLEGLASGAGTLAAFRSRGGRADDTAHVARLARGEGEAAALAAAVLHTSGLATGRVIGGLLNTVDPHVVVLTGGMVEAGPAWMDGLHEGVAMEAMDVVRDTAVVRARSRHAALQGAAVTARQEDDDG